MNLLAPSEHQLLVFWVQLSLLLLVARILGQAFRRIGQPAVVGELTAGLVLGPSILGAVAPGAFDWLFPADSLQSGMLFAVAWIGVVFLLIVTGFETDLELMRKNGRATALVAAGSLLLPFAAGLGVGYLLPGAFRAEQTDQLVFALFIATALSISSLPVIAKILGELGLMRRNFGQTILAAAMANDVVGWLMLGLVAGMATSGRLSVTDLAVSLVGMLLFLVAAFTVGQRLLDGILRRLRKTDSDTAGWLGVVVIASLVAGSITQWLGVEAVLGAFVAGIVIGRSRFVPPTIREHLEAVTAAVFAPVFFATAGLRVDLGLLADASVLWWAAVVLVAASLSKLVGSLLGARLARLPTREGVALGMGLNARGAMEVVIATVGISLGVLTDASYTVIVLMAMVTSMMAPPLLRATVRNWHGSEEEQSRLEREATLARNVVVRNQRLLVASRGGPNSIVAAQVLDLAWPREAAVTVLSVGEEPEPEGIEAVVSVFHEREVEHLHVADTDAVRAIRAEATLGYGVVGVGAPDDGGHEHVLSPVVDEILSEASVPVVIVRRARGQASRLPQAFGRALVPVAASARSRAAQEVAGNLSAAIGTELVLAHVASRERGTATVGGARRRRFARHRHETAAVPGGPTADVGATLLDRAGELADGFGARHRSELLTGPSVADALLQAAGDLDVDVAVVGANLRSLAGRPFLGDTVEELLRSFPGTVVVVATPGGPHG